MLGLLGASSNKTQSYVRMAELAREIGSRPRDDLQELWKRALFAVLISDKDCHLRNHGMIFAGGGWRLAPAFDLVPTPQALRPREMAISLDGVDDRAALPPVLEMAECFSLDRREAREIARQVAGVTRRWREKARQMRLPADEIRAMKPAFEHEELEEALR
jgi:serine/threonine-protein kinase HipA